MHGERTSSQGSACQPHFARRTVGRIESIVASELVIHSQVCTVARTSIFTHLDGASHGRKEVSEV